MWEDPRDLWRRLHLGREEMLQRLMTTLICGGKAPAWNSPVTPSRQGSQFLRLLDALAHGHEAEDGHGDGVAQFVDEYLLPKLDEALPNGWPDWAVLWPNRRVWIIELKTERGSHRPAQLPYYLELAGAAHPGVPVDLTYITGPLSKPAPRLSTGQRYSHLRWEQLVALVEAVWAGEGPEVAPYVEAIRTIIANLKVMRPLDQRDSILGHVGEPASEGPRAGASSETNLDQAPDSISTLEGPDSDVLQLARETAADGRQRGVGACSPTELEGLRDEARRQIGALPADDTTRYVLPWLWRAGQTDGKALTREGDEFGCELRFSRYKSLQVKP